MSFEIVTVVCLIIFMLARELMHYLQVTKLQELLKSVDVTEYYKAKAGDQRQSPSENLVMEDNEIAMPDPDIPDIRKISKVIVDGEEKPINLI